MTKLEGDVCPICKQVTCTHRCDNCSEKFFYPQYFQNGQLNETLRGTRYPCDEYGNRHQDCMKKGTYDGKFHDKHYRDSKNQQAKPEYVNEKSKDLADYMKNMLRLGNDGWWHGWRDGKYVGPVEYAPNDHKSWEPNQQEGE